MRKYRVLAIDGALNHSGWIIIDEKEKADGTRQSVASNYGLILPNPKLSLGFKLSYMKSELTKIVKTYKPSVIVFEDTYAGKNAITNARLNQAKGVFIVTSYELLGEEPVYVNAGIARSCLGFKNNKEEPFEHFSKLLGLTESFEKGNDITDACTLGFWFIASERGECEESKRTKKRIKSIKKTRKSSKNG